MVIIHTLRLDKVDKPLPLIHSGIFFMGEMHFPQLHPKSALRLESPSSFTPFNIPFLHNTRCCCTGNIILCGFVIEKKIWYSRKKYLILQPNKTGHLISKNTIITITKKYVYLSAAMP